MWRHDGLHKVRHGRYELFASLRVLSKERIVDHANKGDAPNMPAKRAAKMPPAGRRYLPTLSDLVDRLTIVQLKTLFIPERRNDYIKEREAIEHDIDLILSEIHENGERITAPDVHAIIAIMLTNHLIWINESKARTGGSEQDKLLKLTHSINGQRNAAKNKLARVDQGRIDFKTDCFAADLVEEFGHLQIF